jgi:2-polyprenyl-3-methyl-5-hydroxy-6-metoxy-1,4-benzoquinol methylase
VAAAPPRAADQATLEVEVGILRGRIPEAVMDGVHTARRQRRGTASVLPRAQIWSKIANDPKALWARRKGKINMAEFHFVEDYEKYVANLIANHPLDEAMNLAVGGNFESVGQIEADILRHFGLRDGMYVIDIGCGSGRLAHALSKMGKFEYLGTDIVQSLLDYAAKKSPTNYLFKLNRALNIPAASNSADYVVVFSVFTHLLHSESFIYLEEAKRVLRLGGMAIFSFLEFSEPGHWWAFEAEMQTRRGGGEGHLNTFIDRGAIAIWARRLGFEVEAMISGCDAPWGKNHLGQAVAVLKKTTVDAPAGSSLQELGAVAS